MQKNNKQPEDKNYKHLEDKVEKQSKEITNLKQVISFLKKQLNKVAAQQRSVAAKVVGLQNNVSTLDANMRRQVRREREL